MTKFKFEFDNVREQFQQIQNLTNVLSALFCYGMRIRGKIFVLRLILYAQTARECRQTCFFSQIQPITQTTVIECAI